MVRTIFTDAGGRKGKSMFRSMTAYGRHNVSTDGREITVELRSVNSKHLDMTVKLPRQLAPLESKIKSTITSLGISRGRVDVFINYALTGADNVNIALDEGYAEGYVAALRELRDKFGLVDDISVMTVAQNRDIFTSRSVDEDPEAVWAVLEPAVIAATREFISERCREGENLRRDLMSKMDGMRTLVDRIAVISENDAKNMKEKLRTRIGNILADNNIVLDENRLLTECAILADRIAIDEEIVRLRSHLDALDAMMDLDVPVGRKFDFQLQEAGREINTIGSKCQSSDIAEIVVTLKNEAEKIREQIQNIE